MLSTLVLVLSSLYLVVGQNEPRKLFIAVTPVQCQGNLTYEYNSVQQWTRDGECTPESEIDWNPLLVGKRDVSEFQILASFSRELPSALKQWEALIIGVSGNFAAKYGYIRRVRQRIPYLKKCSSVLGKSAIKTISYELYVSDYLEPKVLTDPKGALQAFKRLSTSVCKQSGEGLIV